MSNVTDNIAIRDIHRDVTCLLDLSDEILLEICRYLSPSSILYSFYTPSQPDFRLHRIICDYYKNVKFDRIRNNEYNYLSSLLCSSINPLPLKSLILSNEHVSCLIEHYFTYTSTTTTSTMFNNLKCLKLIDCSADDLAYLKSFIINLTKLEELYIRVRKSNEYYNILCGNKLNTFINGLLFDGQILSMKNVSIEINDGIILAKSFIPHQTLTNVNLVLQTIDDLYILLDGLVPNVQIMIIQLSRSRILSCPRPKSTSSCSQLTQFTLLEPRIGFVTSDIKSILVYMSNLIKLTLSIRDTPDPIFSHGPKFESILNEYVPNLRKFDYTMTRRIVDQSSIEDFIQWSMNSVYYSNENCKWIHLFSLPWPSDKNDKRQLPIVNGECNTSVTSHVKRSEYIHHLFIRKHQEFILLKKQFRSTRQITTCLSINIKLPSRISKLILSEETPISSINSIIQPSIRHLIVKYRLTSKHEMSDLLRQFPSVEYLELLFPLDADSFTDCFKSLFNRDDIIKIISCSISFSTDLMYDQLPLTYHNIQMLDWIIQNTNLKHYKYRFYVHCSFSKMSIWF